ncbi:MAG: glycerol-3-phosphate 1-O-acyltransferase PlsY [Firmicutes bacterium]|nr:glycerol-3-phosphate 1-O-acyltransferase PlsY [Bacillota bacterium]
MRVWPLYPLLASYLIGSIPFGVILGKRLAGVDVRQFGSGNIGAANVLRTLGFPFAAATGILDAAKGVAAALLARWAGASPGWTVSLGIAAVAGHDWTPFLGFRGGKGIATTFGFLLVAAPRAALAFSIIWGLVLLLSRYVSLASIVASATIPVICLALRLPAEFVLGTAVLGAMAVWRHRSNIGRLLSGQEYKIGEKAK